MHPLEFRNVLTCVPVVGHCFGVECMKGGDFINHELDKPDEYQGTLTT